MKSWITVQLHQKSQVKPMIPMTPLRPRIGTAKRERSQDGKYARDKVAIRGWNGESWRQCRRNYPRHQETKPDKSNGLPDSRLRGILWTV
jgi:hypothetical protein